MKRTMIFALAASLIGMGPANALAGEVALQASAQSFVDLLAKRDFAGAFTEFDPTMQGALPVEKLGQIWESVQQTSGQFQKRVRSRVEKFGAHQVVFVTCQFARTLLDVKVVFDAQGRIAGLFFAPSQPPPVSNPPPAYANTNAFREVAVRIGSGEWVLPGTLSLPKSDGVQRLPGVVLVHGSGPNDRDETIGPNKPFRDLAWGLASKGVAVLRYEKRTKEHGLKFVASPEITVKEETTDDALLAVAELRKTPEVDSARVFVLGHSLGGMVAPRIGQADPSLAGLIILAGATRPLEDLILEQTRYILSLEGDPSGEDAKKLAQLEGDVAKVKKLSVADVAKTNQVLGAPAKYWLDLRNYDAVATATKLKMPMLILQGQRDYQVTTVDFNNWKNALSSSPNVTLKLYPKLNHLFISGDGRSKPAEYEIPGHVAEEVVQDVAAWINGVASLKPK